MVVGADLLRRPGVDERPLRGVRLRTVTQAELGVHGAAQLVQEELVDPRLHQEAVGADARLERAEVFTCFVCEVTSCLEYTSLLLPHLARVPELGGHGSAHCFVNVSAVKDDEGGVATELHRNSLYRVSRHFQQQLRNKQNVLKLSSAGAAVSSRGRRRLTFPVAVDPVKEIFATSGSVQRTCPTEGVFSLEQGTTLKTPAGIPAFSASCTQEVTSL